MIFVATSLKIPDYMVEDMSHKLVIGGLYFPLPNDAQFMIM